MLKTTSPTPGALLVLASLTVALALPRAAIPGGAAAGSRVTAGSDTARDSLLASEDEYQGWKWFHVYCYRCHGTDALGGQLAPDLRQSVSSQGSVARDVFLTTVRDGRAPKGMPAWNVLLNERQIDQLYAYLKARSDGRLAAGRPRRATDQPPP